MSLAQELGPHLPFVRRYARALTGSQEAGDAFVRATLMALIDNPGSLPASAEARPGLYKLFHTVWSSAHIEVAAEEEKPDPIRTAESRLRRLTPRSRQAFLLTTMESFSKADAAWIIDASESEMENLIETAVAEIDRQIVTDILVIEAEPLISMDRQEIVRKLGHKVAATATTHAEAVKAARQENPGLVLADIQLADGSSGIDAARDILADLSVPVIFITAFPELLLTGDRPEPTYLIAKPFQRDNVKAAISQALFLGSAVSFARCGRSTGPAGSLPHIARAAVNSSEKHEAADQTIVSLYGTFRRRTGPFERRPRSAPDGQARTRRHRRRRAADARLCRERRLGDPLSVA
jgi:CheY-like chemotaxis protein